MKTWTKLIAAAGLATMTVAASATPAEAQRYGHRYDRHDSRYDRHYNRGHHRGWDRGRYYRYNRYHRPHCYRTWRYGHRVTVCRR